MVAKVCMFVCLYDIHDINPTAKDGVKTHK